MCLKLENVQIIQITVVIRHDDGDNFKGFILPLHGAMCVLVCSLLKERASE